MGWEYPTWSHVNGPAVNLLKGGVLTADRVMTVSKVCRLDVAFVAAVWKSHINDRRCPESGGCQTSTSDGL
jgi:hypothetical protein